MKLASISPLLFVGGAFALATVLEPTWSAFQRQQSKSVLEMALGDGRKLFANHFFIKADVYFHKGYYPSIFDQAAASTKTHLTETVEEHAGHHDEEHEKEMDFLGKARDPIDAFGRHFFVSEHAHMGTGDAKELLPWFKVAAELDPNRIETYTTASFWLRNLKKFDEAEQFLREGWRQNPDSFELLLELGRLYETDRGDHERARNVWELALAKWDRLERDKKEPDLYSREQILARLADLEEKQGRLARAIEYLEELKKLSPNPEEIQKQIDERRAKVGK
jgi:tetratricopeptide (TPR) repeat protein